MSAQEATALETIAEYMRKHDLPEDLLRCYQAVNELAIATRAALKHSDKVCDEEHQGRRSPEARMHYNRIQRALARIGGPA